ncbi:acyl-CoA dehydrogenase family protein [Nesterenkonia marinintestina]|uniref:acyl-CoA dehydrogenase family protein n=1 Tax=Nesterenkonia marinintestina TaxID=2979865 RepID=UPI0021C1BC9A|nr:acyl-CoA dehydrogenase family protein [Nesterenkonia sp. GX14115]
MLEDIDPVYDITAPLDLDYYDVLADLPEDALEWRRRTREFTSGLDERMAGHWERGEYPTDLIGELGRRGLLTDGVDVDGLDESLTTLSPLAAAMVNMELSRLDGSVGTMLGVQGGLALRTLALFGSEEQKAEHLADLATGRTFGAFALTEPTHGSDSVSLETTATLIGTEDDGRYVINGAKKWIGNGASGGLTFTWARISGGEFDGKVRCFMIDQSTPGYSAEAIRGKASLRAIDQALISYDDVEVPAAAVLPGSTSFASASEVLFATRLGVAWSAVGHAAAITETALNYARRREQFSKRLGQFQQVQERLTWMVSELTSMQLHARRATELDTAGRLSGPQASLTKYHNTRKARAIAQVGRDMLGGNGILLQNKVIRHMADIEAIHTYEGTESVQSLIVGRDLTGFSAFA